MNLLFQLLPYAVFAGIAATETGYYVMWTSRRRRARLRTPRTLDAPVVRGAPPIEPISHAPCVMPAVVPAVAGKIQILRLSELGISEGHIAAALQLPLQEIQIILNLDRLRRPSAARSENLQPSIVE